MLQNAYFLAKIGADTAENEQHFAEILPTDGADGRPGIRIRGGPLLLSAEPKNRFTLMQGLTNPGKCCRVMLGSTQKTRYSILSRNKVQFQYFCGKIS